MKRNIYLFYFSLLYSILFYFLISDEALTQDVYNYYTKYTWELIDVNKSLKFFTDLFIIGDFTGLQFSMSDVNIAAFIVFGSFSFLPFDFFVFAFIFILSYLSFKLIASVSKIPPFKIFLILFSLPMAVNLHFVWRQFLGELLVMFILFSSVRFKRIKIITVCLFIHPASILAVNEKFFQFFKNVYFSRFLLCLAFGGVGYILASYSTIVLVNYESGSLWNFRHLVWIAILILYILPLFIMRKSSEISNSNIFIFIPVFLVYLFFSSSLVGASRMISFMSVASIVFVLSKTRKFDNYYSVIGLASYLPYLLFFR